MKSIFEQLVDDIDAAIVDEALSKSLNKAKRLKMLVMVRDYQLQVASIMNKIYPEIVCADSDSLDYCKKIHCPKAFVCEAAATKRLRIEGRIIRALDELPEEPICNCKEHRTGCMNQEEARDFNSKKIDPRKTWIY